MKLINGEKRGRPGRWMLDFYDQDGNRRRETYDTQKEAKSAMADRLGEVKTSSYRAPAELPTLEDVAGAWLTAKGLEGLRPSTIAGLENHVHDHILPTLGSIRIDLVSLKSVEALKATLATEKKLAPRTVNKTLAALKAIFDYAGSGSAGYITRNPAASVKPMKLGKSDGVKAENVPSAEEVAKLIDAASPGLHRMFFLTAAHTGARSGELLGLAWGGRSGRPDAHHPAKRLVGEDSGGACGEEGEGGAPLRAEDQRGAPYRQDRRGARAGASALAARLSEGEAWPGVPERCGRSAASADTP
jgi:hypothetical protein